MADAAGVLAMARDLGIGDTLFEHLTTGDRFRFAASPPDETLVKLARGTYRLEGRTRVYRTGSRTAVFRLDPEA